MQHDIVVAGAGIAGLTAALTAARLGRSVMVVTGDVLGGQLLSIEKIDGYPGFPDGVAGYDLGPMAQEQAAAAGAEFMMCEATSIARSDGGFVVSTAEGDVEARAVIAATGSALKHLGVPGEARLTGKGVSHCATCDGPLYRDKVVAVIGGGDSGVQEALTVAQFVAKVIVIERGSDLTAQSVYRAAADAEPKIEVRLNTTVDDILGDTVVAGLKLSDGSQVDVSGVFVYVGFDPVTGWLDGVSVRDAAGLIPTDAAMRTAEAGVFAAGTLRAGSSCRAASSAGDGAAAAIAADRYLTSGVWRDGEDGKAAA